MATKSARFLRQLSLPGQLLNIFPLLLLALLTGLYTTPKIWGSNPRIVVSGSLPNGTVGSTYAGTVSARGGSAPYSYSVRSGILPPGLTVNKDSGIVSGTPTQTGSFNFEIGAVDRTGAHADTSFTVRVTANISITISPASASLAAGGSQQFTAYLTGTSNTGVTWTATSGTVSSSGLFSAPSVPTPSSAVVTATSAANPAKSASASVTINPKSSGPKITTTSIPMAMAGISYTASLAASGGATPYTWSLGSGSLPAGIQVYSAGAAISGTTSQQGSFPFTIRVTDAAGNSATQGFTLIITHSSGTSYTAFVEPRNSTKGFSVVNSNGTSGTIINYPSPLPNTGTNLGKPACYGNMSCIYGINTVFTDDSFPAGLRHRYVRITDATTGTVSTPWVTADAGGAVVSNADSTVWLVKNPIANSFKLVQFDPVAFQVTGSLAIQGKITFDPTDPNTLYTYSGLTGTLRTGTLSTDDPSGKLSKGNLSLSINPANDISLYSANCVPAGTNIRWSSIFRWSLDGSSITLGVGPGQDLTSGAYWIVNYTRGKGLRCININPPSGYMYLVGDWGPGTPGPTYLQNPDGTVFTSTMTLHSSTQTQNPDWMDWETNHCTPAKTCLGPIFWNISTLTLYRCDALDRNCSSGHDVKGFTGMIHDHTNQMQSYMNLANSYPMTPYMLPDDHKTYWNNDMTDTKPVFMSNTKCWGSAGACALGLNTITAPFYYEITAVSPSNNLSGSLMRFGHTFSSGQNMRFDAQYAIANIDRSGCFIAFGTDFLGRFGNLNSSDTLCDAAAPKNQCRADVLIMDLCHAY